MNEKDLIQQMNAYGQRKAQEEQQKQANNEKEKELAIQKIKALKPRIQKLIRIGQAALDNNIIRLSSMDSSDQRAFGYFRADGWHHQLGFISTGGYMPRTIKAMGIEGGGCCYYNLETDGTYIKVSGRDALYVLNRFLKEIDKFEEDLLRHIELACSKK